MLRKILVLCVLGAAACRTDPNVARRKAIETGDRYFSDGKFTEASIEYRRAIQYDARSGQAHSKLAKTYLALGDARAAYGEVIRAADLLPDDADAQIRAGQMLLLAGQYEDARQRARELLKRSPENVDAQILLGNALAGLKDLDGAISQVEEAIDTDPRRTLSYANLGQLQLVKGDRPAAEKAFRQAVAADPKSEMPHLALANYYWASNDTPAAEQELKTAVGLNPKSILANQALATYYMNLHRPSDAEPYLKAFAGLSAGVGPKLTLADLYLTMARDRDARVVLEPLVARPDGFIPAKLRLAAIDYAGGHQREAREGITAILKRDPQNEAARLVNVRFLLNERKYTEALALAKSVVDADPRSVPGHFFKGVALESIEPADAVSEFQEVLRLNPAALPAELELARLHLSRGDASGAATFAAQAVKQAPRSRAAHLMLVEALLAQGNLRGAESEVALLVRTAPSSADVRVAAGQLAQAKHDLVGARVEFAKALQLEPTSLDALRGLTGLDLLEKRFPDARQRIEARLATDAHDPKTLLLAANTYAATGDSDRAEQTFRRAIEVDPANLDAYQQLAILYVTQRRLDEARSQFEEQARRSARPIAAMTMIGMILDIQQRPDEARKKYEQVLALDPDAAVAANNLAWSYANVGDNLDVALKLAQTAKAGMPDRHEVDDTLGWVYYKRGLPGLAIESLKRSVASRPDNSVYAFHLGLAYAQKGDRDEARRSLQRALKLKADFDGADEARRMLNLLSQG